MQMMLLWKFWNWIRFWLKCGLISDGFHKIFNEKYQLIILNIIYLQKRDAQVSDLALFLGDLSRGEKNSEIKLPVKGKVNLQVHILKVNVAPR